MNAAECLLEAGADAAIAIECGEQRICYGELRIAVARAGGAWKDAGLQPGDRVIVFAPDGIDWVLAYLGAIWAGGVAIGVNHRLGMADLAVIVEDSLPAYLWLREAEAPAVAAMASGLSHRPTVVCANAVAGCRDWADAWARARPMEAFPRDDEDPALWIGTSGTTGAPKGVIHAQRVVRHAHAFAAGVLGLTAADRLYSTSKLFFAYALGNSLFAGLRLGATVILDPDWSTPERVRLMLARHAPSVLFSVPTLYSKMLQAGIAGQVGGSSVRHCVSAGEALPATVRSEWTAASGLAPISGYGTSETLCLMLRAEHDDGLLRPTPRTEVRDDEDAEAAVPRRIWLRAPTIALGYWNRPAAEADGFRDGWFSPGDMFLPHADGTHEFVGRSDDLLKISGQWVSTLWIEQALATACGEVVAQLAAVGAPTADGLTAIAILAVAGAGREGDARDCLARGIEGLPKHRRPRWVHWVDELPLTATGKLQRGRLRALHDRLCGGA